MNSGDQQGDPEKMSEILIEIVNNSELPLHLLLGADTYQIVIDQPEKEKQEIEKWKKITLYASYHQPPQ
jgi:hypothetical protein